jgi:predicted nucleotidyltransferase
MDLIGVRAYLEAREGQRFQTREETRLRALEMARAAIQTVLPVFPRVRRAFLFGSITRPGAMRRDSDIDIAVEGDLTAEEYFALWRALDREISGWQVEVVELEKDLHFAERVRKTGEKVYEAPNSNAQGGHHR